jgi:ribosomal-protein-alanine N-acetyltransferase
MRLETCRIILRPFEKKDLEDLNEYCSQDGVGEMAGWKHHCNLLTSKEVLDRNIQNENIFAIENKENRKVIGHIAVNNDSENGREDTKELGCALNRNYQNKGIMTEVIYQILDYLFSKDIKYVYACCFQSNKPSKGLIEKCGFTFEQEGLFYSKSLNKTFKSFEYVYSKNDWQLQKRH